MKAQEKWALPPLSRQGESFAESFLNGLYYIAYLGHIASRGKNSRRFFNSSVLQAAIPVFDKEIETHPPPIKRSIAIGTSPSDVMLNQRRK